ncbi:hypothetical protein [Jeotgalibaca dankookensis]|nr:hypothetical protein [Jeotgalibaca dankookensis]
MNTIYELKATVETVKWGYFDNSWDLRQRCRTKRCCGSKND